MRIFAEIPNGNVFAFLIERHEKIIDLKLKIEKLISLKINNQMLLYENELMDNANNLDHYKIVDKSLISIKKQIQIFANIQSLIPIYVQTSDKILNIKRKLHEKIGIDPSEQIWYYHGKELHNDKTVGYYQIDEQSVIDVVSCARSFSIDIFVKNNDHSFKIVVKNTDKISYVKNQIGEIILTCNNFELCLNGHRLNLFEDKRVYDYDISSGDTMIVYNSITGGGGKFRIYVKTIDGKKDEIFVDYSNKIGKIRMKIREKFRINPNDQKLIFQGQILDDDVTVAYYNIQHGDIITLCDNSAERRAICIDVQTIDMEIGKISICYSDNIREIKIKISEKFKIHPNDQKLIFEGQTLDDKKTFLNYNIYPGQIILVYYKNPITVNATNADGETMKFIVNRNATISNVKMLLYQKFNLNAFKQILYHNNLLMEDNKVIGEYLSVEIQKLFDFPISMRFFSRQAQNGEIVINILVKLRPRNVLKYNMTVIPIGDDKWMIRETVKFEHENQKLIIHSKQLENDKLSYEYFIVDKSVFSNYSNFKNFNLFIKFIKEGLLDKVKKYYQKNFIEMKHGLYSRTPLLYACKFRHNEIIKYLIKKKCNLESFDFELRRALHYAILTNNNEIVSILLANNAHVNAPDYCGNSPIHLACQMNNFEGVQLLIENNCDINLLDQLNQFPLEIAEKGKFVSLIKLLKEYQMNCEIAREMQLKCNEGCDHKFCYKSFQCKNFDKSDIIGKGSFGMVYLCKESMTNRKFAVKLINRNDSKYIEANINEFKDLILHERIIKYFGAYVQKVDYFIFMEYLDGGSLEKQIEKVKMTTEKVLSYTKQLLEALEFLHGHNIIHRDIKPENVLLDNNINENLKLTDFGYSILLSSVNDERQKAISFCGTIYYIAPEIMNGEEYSCSADIWSLGATVIEISKGKRKQNKPYIAMDKVSVTRKIEYELPENMPIYIKKLIDMMLEPNQSSRASASKLLAFVQPYLKLSCTGNFTNKNFDH